MESKFRSTVEKKKASQADLHIPAIAGSLFALFIVIAMIGPIVGDGRYPDWAIGLWVAVWTMIGVTILFALKVASQWEKVVVLRLGKFTGLKGPGMFWI